MSPPSLYLLAWLPVLTALCLYVYQRRPWSEPVGVHTLKATFPTHVVSLTQELVNIESPTGDEQPAFDYARMWIERQNYTAIVQAIAPLTAAHAGRSNVLAVHPDAEPSDVRVVLSTHLDTVPVHEEQAVRREEGRLYGRGSVDAKGQAAAMLVAMTRVNDRRVATLLVCGEERGHEGMLHAHELLKQRVSLINGEPTESKIATRQKGTLRARILVTGRAAHSGYPHLGESAIDKLLEVLQRMRSETCVEEGVTLNVGLIEGGIAPNVVADAAEATLLWRIVGNASEVAELARGIAGEFEGVRMIEVKMNDGMGFFEPRMADETGRTTVAYNTDVPYYRGEVDKVVLFGAGSIAQAHTKDEFIDVEELERLPGLYEGIARELLETRGGQL